MLNRFAPALFALVVCLAACQQQGALPESDAGELVDAGQRDSGHIDPPHDAGTSDAGESTDAGMSDGGGTPQTPKQWMAQYIHAVCAPMTRCPYRSGDPYLCEVIGCNKNVSQVTGPQAALQASLKDEVMIDADKLAACLHAYENRPCEWFDVQSLEAYPECAGAITPRVSVGGICSSADSCEAGTECVSGTCQTQAAGHCERSIDCPEGQLCSAGGACVTSTIDGTEGQHCSVYGTCAPGFMCVGPSTQLPEKRICHAMVAEGEACSSTVPCTPDFVCNGNGTCQPPFKEGDPCTSKCGWDLSDLVCGKTSNQCLYLPKSGPCLEGHCNDIYAYCDTTQATPTCMPLKKEGDVCASTTECKGQGVPSPITCVADGQGVQRCTRTGKSRCE